jgi:hypothetical protein
MMAAHLVAAGTRSEVSVGQVELLDAERTALVFVVVDELVLLYARHDGWMCSGTCRGVKEWRSGEKGDWARRVLMLTRGVRLNCSCTVRAAKEKRQTPS